MELSFIGGGVAAPKGFTANGIHCGIRKNKEKKDLALIYCEKDCDAAAVYTQNLVCGAPITVTRENISDGKARAIVCNSGIANTCNADGVEKAEEMCKITADALGISKSDIVVINREEYINLLNFHLIEKEFSIPIYIPEYLTFKEFNKFYK